VKDELRKKRALAPFHQGLKGEIGESLVLKKFRRTVSIFEEVTN
jgi:hypothetical protein